MMPEKAGASRAMQKTAIAGVIHEKETDGEIGDLLNQLKGVQLDDVQSANVREAARACAAISNRVALLVSARLESSIRTVIARTYLHYFCQHVLASAAVVLEGIAKWLTARWQVDAWTSIPHWSTQR